MQDQGEEYSWYKLYLGAVLESDPSIQMQSIALALTAMSERSELLPHDSAERSAIQNSSVALESMQRRAARVIRRASKKHDGDSLAQAG
jgi:hypothetical protein